MVLTEHGLYPGSALSSSSTSLVSTVSTIDHRLTKLLFVFGLRAATSIVGPVEIIDINKGEV